MRRYLPFIFLTLIIIIGYTLFTLNRAIENEHGSGPAAHPANDATTASQPDTARPSPPRPASFPDVITRLPSASAAESLHSADTSPEDDLSLIHSILRSHRSALGSNPVGLNDEITAALAGKNTKGAASIQSDHPAISAKKELLDRWGTPYRFHAYSGKLMKVSSAGPDKKFFTSDDMSLTE
ncbi:MAG: hypothetical protein AB8F34_05880 [Akkermansiaceae bacterium]